MEVPSLSSPSKEWSAGAPNVGHVSLNHCLIVPSDLLGLMEICASCRGPHIPATPGGDRCRKECPGGITDVSPEREDVGNPEIRVPVTTKDGQPTRSASVEEEGDAKDEDRQRREPPSESGEEKQRKRGTLDKGGQGIPRTLADRHVPGEVWLRQTYLSFLSFPFSPLTNAMSRDLHLTGEDLPGKKKRKKARNKNPWDWAL
ncbi:hypothetical protein NDU88_007645 [Pleurodeles waltl]|uniref:Uncharacterized protein n=1 Tax=Pleurodeles waltl TaxID=8319 RepID=A0AAV7NTQ4_PLEWA|nr:hypothetical protein NDU88_007645 [Pleurodeles waltl]